MMITRETDYAIRVLLCLAQPHAAGGPLPASELAARMEIPYRFLRALSRKLVAAQLVRSKRGNGGGLSLARPPHTISLLAVIRAIDPNSLVLNRCLLAPDACARCGHCPVHGPLAGLQAHLEELLEKLRFDQFSSPP